MSRERSVAGSAAVVAVGTLASRVLGALRDASVAATFSLAVTDVFWVAFVIPNSLRVILAEGAMSGALVPVFAEVRARDGEPAALRFFARFLFAMTGLLLLVSAAGVLFAEPLMMAFASGFAEDPARFEDAVATTRLVFPYVALMGLAAMATGVLQSKGRFAAGAFAPSLLNVAFLLVPFTTLPLARRLGLSDTAALALAALLGGTLHLLALLPSLARSGALVAPERPRGDADVRRAFTLLVPMLVGLGVYQLNVASSRQFLSHAGVGATSYLFYAQRLVEIPQGLFALAVGSAVLPSIARAMAEQRRADAFRLLDEAVRLTWFVALPSSVALFVLADPFVDTLFGHGRFDAAAVRETAASLRLQAVGIGAIAAVRTLVPMFHGGKDTRAPVVASAVNLLTFVGVSAAFVGPYGHRAVGAALSVAGLAQCVTLLGLLARRAGGSLSRSTWGAALRMLVASALAAAPVVGLAPVLEGVTDDRPLFEFGALALLGLVFGAVYLGAAHLLGVPEGRRLSEAIGRRVGRGRVA